MAKTWYGIVTFGYSLKISEASVVRETPQRIYLSKEQMEKSSMRAVAYLLKKTSYEEWYPSREEAAKVKLAKLKDEVRRKNDDVADAKKRLKLFIAQEGL